MICPLCKHVFIPSEAIEPGLATIKQFPSITHAETPIHCPSCTCLLLADRNTITKEQLARSQRRICVAQ